jgi:phosphoribosylformylglycinamidine synthase
MILKAIINIGLKQGVLDSQGKATHHTLDTIGFKEVVKDVRIGKQVIMELNCTDKDEAYKQVASMCENLLANTVIEDYEIIIEE